MPGDLTAVILFGLIVSCLVGYLLYAKRRMDQLDRIIAEKEAAMNAPSGAAPTPR